jgi:hypothetical protein
MIALVVLACEDDPLGRGRPDAGAMHADATATMDAAPGSDAEPGMDASLSDTALPDAASDAATPDVGLEDAAPSDASPEDAEVGDAALADASLDRDGGAKTDARVPVADRCARTLPGPCSSDLECETGGCGGELCGPGASGFVTTCDCAPDPSWACGCVEGTCAWWTP